MNPLYDSLHKPRAPFLRFFPIARAGNLRSQPALFMGRSNLTRDSSYVCNEPPVRFATQAPCPVLAIFFYRKGGKPQISTSLVHGERSAAESKNLLLVLPANGWESSNPNGSFNGSDLKPAPPPAPPHSPRQDRALQCLLSSHTFPSHTAA